MIPDEEIAELRNKAAYLGGMASNLITRLLSERELLVKEHEQARRGLAGDGSRVDLVATWQAVEDFK